MNVHTLRPTLGAAVAWIAENDEPTEHNHNRVSELISVMLVADLFGKTPWQIACRVVNLRREVLTDRVETIEITAGWEPHP